MSDTFDHELDDYNQNKLMEGYGSPSLEPEGCTFDTDDIDYKTLNIVKVVRDTDKAYLVELKSGYQPWVPKSQCKLHSSGLMISIPSWLQDNIKKDARSKSKKKMKKPKAFCKYCGNDKVEWSETDEGWRLFNKKDGAQHVCYFNPPKGII